MKKRWGKGEPVNLSDLLRITPVAHEIMNLSEELGMGLNDVMWIVSQIVENNYGNADNEDIKYATHEYADEDWESIDIENAEEEMEQALYLVNVKVNGPGRFPEIGFKAGVNDMEDMNYFFEMVLEMIDKLD